ncbi:MAG: Fur family transcriptional regulator [Chloroflexota bacterium]
MNAEATARRPNIIAALEDQGYRITGPRRTVARAISDRSAGFTAEELSAELPQVGRATVYRVIKLLLDMGVICKLSLPDGAPVYVASRVEHHHHFICTSCGDVGEFRDQAVERVLRSLAQEIGGEIQGHRMEFYIRCSACVASQS